MTLPILAQSEHQVLKHHRSVSVLRVFCPHHSAWQRGIPSLDLWASLIRLLVTLSRMAWSAERIKGWISRPHHSPWQRGIPSLDLWASLIRLLVTLSRMAWFMRTVRFHMERGAQENDATSEARLVFGYLQPLQCTVIVNVYWCSKYYHPGIEMCSDLQFLSFVEKLKSSFNGPAGARLCCACLIMAESSRPDLPETETRSLGKIPILTIIFFKGVGSTTNQL